MPEVRLLTLQQRRLLQPMHKSLRLRADEKKENGFSPPPPNASEYKVASPKTQQAAKKGLRPQQTRAILLSLKPIS